jgi:hypothetical protein
MGAARTGPGQGKDPLTVVRPGLFEPDLRSMAGIVPWVGVRRAL